MTGAIAGMSVVKRETHKKKPLPDKNPTAKIEATKPNDALHLALKDFSIFRLLVKAFQYSKRQAVNKKQGGTIERS